MPALKDEDGDYWIKYGATGDGMCCLANYDGEKAGPWFIESSGGLPASSLIETDYGPFVRVYLDLTEVPVPEAVESTCEACLFDRHFCYECDDAVSHGHVHTEG